MKKPEFQHVHNIAVHCAYWMGCLHAFWTLSRSCTVFVMNEYADSMAKDSRKIILRYVSWSTVWYPPAAECFLTVCGVKQFSASRSCCAQLSKCMIIRTFYLCFRRMILVMFLIIMLSSLCASKLHGRVKISRKRKESRQKNEKLYLQIKLSYSLNHAHNISLLLFLRFRCFVTDLNIELASMTTTADRGPVLLSASVPISFLQLKSISKLSETSFHW